MYRVPYLTLGLSYTKIASSKIECVYMKMSEKRLYVFLIRTLKSDKGFANVFNYFGLQVINVLTMFLISLLKVYFCLLILMLNKKNMFSFLQSLVMFLAHVLKFLAFEALCSCTVCSYIKKSCNMAMEKCQWYDHGVKMLNSLIIKQWTVSLSENYAQFIPWLLN